MVDHQWAVDQLEAFVAKVDQMSDLYDTIHSIGSDRHEAAEVGEQINEIENDLCQQEPAIQIIMDAVDPDLRDYQRFDPDLGVLYGGLSWSQRWLPARRAALTALGLHTVGAEAKQRMQPDNGAGAPAIRLYSGADFELVWPRELFVQEAQTLLAQGGQGFHDRAEWLLTEAFAGSAAADALADSRSYHSPWDEETSSDRPRNEGEFLSQLVASADQLREATARVPYWSQRRRGTTPGPLDKPAIAREFTRIVSAFHASGYLDKAIPKVCVDDHDSVYVDAADVIEQMIGIPALRWPLDSDQLLTTEDALFDVIEALHDLVARPRARSLHSYGGCGWHYTQFAIEPARTLYRWRVNQLLDRSNLGLRLADDGEDAGRLVAVTDDARADLLAVMTSHPDGVTGDRIRHGIALFRARAATEHDKRSAIIALAGILEERRTLLKDHLAKKDEGALFDIANNFAVRHHNDKQQNNYDPMFLDWIFWWYLATIELSDKLIARTPRRADTSDALTRNERGFVRGH